MTAKITPVHQPLGVVENSILPVSDSGANATPVALAEAFVLYGYEKSVFLASNVSKLL
jgi:hypothetical protein